MEANRFFSTTIDARLDSQSKSVFHMPSSFSSSYICNSELLLVFLTIFFFFCLQIQPFHSFFLPVALPHPPKSSKTDFHLSRSISNCPLVSSSNQTVIISVVHLFAYLISVLILVTLAASLSLPVHVVCVFTTHILYHVQDVAGIRSTTSFIWWNKPL